MNVTGNDPETVLRIRDPELDQGAIMGQVREAIQRRQEGGGYGPDISTLGPESLRPQDADADQTDLVLLYLQTALDDLAARSQLQEPDFHSDVPVLGPLVVRVRRLWNWMAAKWYVLGWMEQQAAFNSRVVSIVSELFQMQESNERHIRDLELELQRLLRDKEDVQ